MFIIELKTTTEKGSPWKTTTVKGIGFVTHEGPVTITFRPEYKLATAFLKQDS